MKRTILVLMILFTPLLFGETPQQVFEQSLKKAAATNYISFNLIDRLKSFEADNFIADTMYVLAKRNGFVPGFNALIRIQYENGNVNVFNGEEIKMLDVDEKTLFVADTSEGAYEYVMSEGMHFFIKKHLAGKDNRLNFTDYTYKFLDDTTLDNQDCYQISIFSKFDSSKFPAGDNKIVEDSAVLAIAKADDMIRRFYRVVTMDNGLKQIEDELFTNIESTIPIDDLMFDISLPQGFKLVTPKQQLSKEETLLPIGSDAPKWVLGDENGKEYKLSDYYGKVVVLDFWGTWCKWCKQAMPKIQEIYEDYKGKDVAIFGISCQEPANADPEGFMALYDAKYQLLLQGDEVANHYQIKGFPTLYVIDKYGKVAFTFVGYTDKMKETVEEVINKELAR